MSNQTLSTFTHIGEKIKFLRISNNMSQNALAAAINSNRERVYDYEKGTIKHPDMYFIESIADCFDVSLDYFRKPKGENSNDTNTAN